MVPYASQEDFEDSFTDGEMEDSRPETVQAEAGIQEIRQRLRVDGEFFINFYMGDEISTDVPHFHVEVWQLLTNTAMQRVMLAIPRDHAKTTLSKLCVVWYFLFTSHRFCVYLSNTNTIAKNACKDIINYMKSSNHTAVWGPIRITKESETDSLWQFELTRPDGSVKKCILRAVGAGQQMRGINIDNQRPDIAVVDDVEDNENTDSELLQKKLDKWIFGPFIKALARQKKIIWLGNMLQKTSLLARLSRNPKWNPVVFGALVKNPITGRLEPLWPERWSVAELQEDFQEYKGLGLIETWLCEMMNMPGHGKNGFNAEQLFYQIVPTPGEIQAAWMCLDPAFGKEAHNDDSSITLHILPENGVPMVATQITGKMSEHEIFENMLALALYWNCWVWGIEAIAAQRVLITLFQILLTTKALANRVEFIPLMAGKGDPKVSRIRAFVSLMAAKEYAIPEGDIEVTQQILNYNTTTKNQRDDLIDSCSYGPQMLQQYLPLLLAHFNGSDWGESVGVQQGTEVASI